MTEFSISKSKQSITLCGYCVSGMLHNSIIVTCQASPICISIVCINLEPWRKLNRRLCILKWIFQSLTQMRPAATSTSRLNMSNKQSKAKIQEKKYRTKQADFNPQKKTEATASLLRQMTAARDEQLSFYILLVLLHSVRHL